MIKIDKILRDKKTNSAIYILIAIGIMLMILGGSIKSMPEKTVTDTAFSRAEEAERILSEIDGVGSVRVMISPKKDKNDAVFSDDGDDMSDGGSVLIVADGGADSRVKEKIIKAASAALGVGPHKIVVFERKE